MSIHSMNLNLVPGTLVEDAIGDAIELAKRYHCIVFFKFNGEGIEVNPEDTFEEVYRRWDSLRRSKRVWEYKEVNEE